MLLYFLLIVGFTYFYVAITFNPVDPPPPLLSPGFPGSGEEGLNEAASHL